MTTEKTPSSTSVDSIVRQHGKERIEAYRDYDRRCCVSDWRMKRIIAKGRKVTFDRISFRVGSIVRSEYVGESKLWFVVGHGFTGDDGTSRGCHACQVTDRIFKRWQWIGPESQIKPA